MPYRRIQGASLLQSRHIAFEQAPTYTALKKLKNLGANSVALIAFIEQDRPDALELSVSDAVSHEQIKAAVKRAKQLDLRVILKPQILIPGSWAGEVQHSNDADWQAWFRAYQEILLDYARLAQMQHVEILVVGTELKHAARRPEWRSLIQAVRRVYHGELSYSAHNLDGLKNFAYWSLLDSASVTLYPSLGNSGRREEIEGIIQQQAEALKRFSEALRISLWIAEIGIASRQGAFKDPWRWDFSPAERHALQADEELQALVLGLWLHALQGSWNQGILLWNWYNDPQAGGPGDTDFTPQNKLAEQVIGCAWSRLCSEKRLLENL